ncbi:hypothetical protein ACHAPU_000663 [Fusarium lateritium]
MAVYVRNELEPYSEQMTVSTLSEFMTELLRKAQSVFLWLVLATKSLTNGIKNGDDERTLSDRLHGLPSQLQALYEAMWSRLNGDNAVYREIAAKYFRCLISHESKVDIGYVVDGKMRWTEVGVKSLAMISLLMKGKSQCNLESTPCEETLDTLTSLCDATAADLHIRCAGMLRIGEESVFESFRDKDYPQIPLEIFHLTRSVHFIHRTAHDFLVDTEAGQAILNYKSSTRASLDLRAKRLESWLCLAVFCSRFGLVLNFRSALQQCMLLEDVGAGQQIILRQATKIQDLWNRGVLGSYSKDLFLEYSIQIIFAYGLKSFEDVFLSRHIHPYTPEAMTAGLRDIAAESNGPAHQCPPVDLIKRMIALGGDPHAIGLSLLAQKASQEDQQPFQDLVNSLFDSQETLCIMGPKTLDLLEALHDLFSLDTSITVPSSLVGSIEEAALSDGLELLAQGDSLLFSAAGLNTVPLPSETEGCETVLTAVIKPARDGPI